jgi:predicted enzyme related to lactoylglutathione lyase
MSPPSVCLVSIPVRDLQKAYKFYNAVLGWEVAKQFPTMWILNGPGETSLSLETGWEPSGGSGIQFFFKVEDPQACLKKVEANGGEVIEKPMTIPDYGTYAIAEDPDGNRLGFQQPAT